MSMAGSKGEGSRAYIKFRLGQQARGDGSLAVLRGDGLGVVDALVHLGVREHGLVAFVVPVAAVADLQRTRDEEDVKKQESEVKGGKRRERGSKGDGG